MRRAKRGDVYWVSLDPTIGTEIRKTRPAVVVSNDPMNAFGTRVVMVPLTSNVDTCYPGEAIVKVNGKRARALGDQLRSLDRSRLQAKLGSLSERDLSLVEEALRITLAL